MPLSATRTARAATPAGPGARLRVQVTQRAVSPDSSPPRRVRIVAPVCRQPARSPAASWTSARWQFQRGCAGPSSMLRAGDEVSCHHPALRAGADTRSLSVVFVLVVRHGAREWLRADLEDKDEA